MKNLKDKLKKIRNQFDSGKIDAYFIYNPSNIRYLSGFNGSSGYILITPRKGFFFTDFRYKEQIKKNVHPYFDGVIHSNFTEDLKKYVKPYKRIGFEKEYLPYGIYLTFRKKWDKKLVPMKDLVSSLRTLKGEMEVRLISKAQRITEKVFNEILEVIYPEKMTERELAAEIEYRMKKYGAEGNAFPTIVASGSNSALPHARSTNRYIKKNAPLKIDIGAIYKGYCSDMTRTIWIGRKPGKKFKQVYDVVKTANIKAFESIPNCSKMKEVDMSARELIERAGYGKYFGHGLGHGIGMEVHEAPSVSPKSEDKLQNGFVFTIEPGIYLPGYGGVRIEDMVYIKNGKPINLTRISKELIKV